MSAMPIEKPANSVREFLDTRRREVLAKYLVVYDAMMQTGLYYHYLEQILERATWLYFKRSLRTAEEYWGSREIWQAQQELRCDDLSVLLSPGAIREFRDSLKIAPNPVVAVKPSSQRKTKRKKGKK